MPYQNTNSVSTLWTHCLNTSLNATAPNPPPTTQSAFWVSLFSVRIELYGCTTTSEISSRLGNTEYVCINFLGNLQSKRKIWSKMMSRGLRLNQSKSMKSMKTESSWHNSQIIYAIFRKIMIISLRFQTGNSFSENVFYMISNFQNFPWENSRINFTQEIICTRSCCP